MARRLVHPARAFHIRFGGIYDRARCCRRSRRCDRCGAACRMRVSASTGIQLLSSALSSGSCGSAPWGRLSPRRPPDLDATTGAARRRFQYPRRSARRRVPAANSKLRRGCAELQLCGQLSLLGLRLALLRCDRGWRLRWRPFPSRLPPSWLLPSRVPRRSARWLPRRRLPRWRPWPLTKPTSHCALPKARHRRP
jgi:hypothetical protein